MSKEILFARHGESTANAEGIVAGHRNVPLTARGVAEAGMLRDRLKETPLDMVISSALTRAYETARIVAEPHRLAVFRWPELSEVNFGEAEGKKRFVEGESPALERLGNGTLSGAETLYQLRRRAELCWNQLRQLQPDRICVVGHATFTAIMFAVNEGVPSERFLEYRKAFNLKNGEVRTVKM